MTKHTSTRMAALLLALLLTLPLTLFQGVVAEPADGSEELTYLCPPEDFEDYTVGDNTLPAADFGGLPDEYSIKEENGNKYFSLPNVEVNNDKSIAMKTPGNAANPTAKLIIEGSYRYDKKAEAAKKGEFICQLLDSRGGWRWRELMLISTYDGRIQVQDHDGNRSYLDYTLQPGVWYDFVWAFDPVAGLVNIYINNELVAVDLPYGGTDYLIAANNFFAVKTVKGSYSDPDTAVTMDFDNGAMYYAPAVTATLNGEVREMAYGDVLDLSRNGYSLQATVTCNGETTVTNDPYLPLFGDTEVTVTYTPRELAYLNRVDFEDVETGKYTKDDDALSAYFKAVPTTGYEIKEEDGNRYVSMSLGTYNDAFTLKNPVTDSANGKLVIELSYRYTKQDASGKGWFLCQVTSNWTSLVEFRSHDGSIYVGENPVESGVRLEPGVWNDLVIVLDPAADTAALYLNGALVTAGRSLGNGKKSFDSLKAEELIIAKVSGDRAGGAEATLDIDDVALYYAPAATVTVNGEVREMGVGDIVDLSKDGYTMTQATITCNGRTTVTVNPLAPVLGDTVIEAQYIESDIDYLNYMDFETVEPGTPDLSPWFTSTPTTGYTVKEEDGNKYVSMSLGTYNDAFMLANPATDAAKGKLVVEVSYRYTKQDNGEAGDWICQLYSPWNQLVRIKSQSGAVYVGNENDTAYTWLDPDTWYHLLMVADPATDTVTLYIDGELIAEDVKLQADLTTQMAGRLYIAKVSTTQTCDATLDVDNIRFYYAPTYTVTVNGSAQQVTLGDTLPMPEGAEFAVVTDRDGARVVTGESIPVLGDLTVYTSDSVIYTLPGASLRTDIPTGLRFQTVLLQALVEAGNITDISIGTLFAPTAYVQQAGAFTKEALEAAGLADPYLDVQAAVGQWYPGAAPVDGLYTFAGSVVGIPEAAYSQQLSAVGYVTVTLDDGQTLTVYSLYSEADHSRSVADVAAAALADPDNGLSDAQLAQVQAIADAAGVSAAN